MRKGFRNKKRLFEIILVSIFIFIGALIFFRTKKRNKHLIGCEVAYAVGKITDLKFGAKVSPNYEYVFQVNNLVLKSKYYMSGKPIRNELYSVQKSNVNKNFFIKYSVKNPKYSELLLKYPVPDSLLNCNDCVWDKIPTEVKVSKGVKKDTIERLSY